MCDRKGGQWILKLAEIMKNEKVFFILVGVESNNVHIKFLENSSTKFH